MSQIYIRGIFHTRQCSCAGWNPRSRRANIRSSSTCVNLMIHVLRWYVCFRMSVSTLSTTRMKTGSCDTVSLTSTCEVKRSVWFYFGRDFQIDKHCHTSNHACIRMRSTWPLQFSPTKLTKSNTKRQARVGIEKRLHLLKSIVANQR